jgi:hypothetical protein
VISFGKSDIHAKARLKKSVVSTTAQSADGGRFTLKTMSAGSCCSWSWASRATRGPRWSTSCCGHDVACDDDAGRHDIVMGTTLAVMPSSSTPR